MRPTEPEAGPLDGRARPPEVDAVLDGWMRREAAAVHARLLQRFGWGRPDLAEDALQHALLRALETWPYRGVPERPRAWLLTVASNHIRNALQSAAERRSTSLDDSPEEALASGRGEALPGSRGEITDPELAVLFALCHPRLPAKSAIAVALQVLCGFSLREIASALLMAPDAVARRLSRAKRSLRGIPESVANPTGPALGDRLPAALDVIALLFNEGFEPSAGERAMRVELCSEAVRLANALAEHAVTGGPESRALAALLHLLFARLPARLADPEAVTLLDEQDRSAWDPSYLRRGLELLRASAEGERVSRYHLLAGIAAAHAAAPSVATTDWNAIVRGYELLLELENSPVHRLNYAVALQRSGAPEAAREEVEQLAGVPAMRGYLWFHLVRADIHGDDDALRSTALSVATTLARTPVQVEAVRRKIPSGRGAGRGEP